MDVALFVLADYALYSSDQKLSVMGMFQNLYAVQFPATHPIMYVVTQLRASRAEYGRSFELRIRLLDEDATILLDLPNNLQVQPATIPGHAAIVNNIMVLQAIQFPRPGRYEFSLLIDHDEKATIPLEISLIQPPAPDQNIP